MAYREVDITKVRDGMRTKEYDCATTEEPLEIRLHGRPFAVVMRTPGADINLVAGFLLAERVVRSNDDFGAIEHCSDPSSDKNRGNVVDVTLVGNATDRLNAVLAERRQVAMNASCGMCGRLTIESLTVEAPAVNSDLVVSDTVLAAMPERLRRSQGVFHQTGGLHAAGLFTPSGDLIESAEDVGRHNAVDKVVGSLLLGDGLPLSSFVLVVSGRASFEIVQKATLARIPVVAAVSAPSTLAIDLARETGITLVGFLRGGSFNIYAHAERIKP